MRLALSLAACLTLLPLAAPPALAAGMTLTKAAEPVIYRPAGVMLDVLGIKLGMSPDAVRAALATSFDQIQATEDNLGLEYRGVAVSTAPYVTKLVAKKGADEVTVWFATPTTGNGVVEVTRQTSYLNPAIPPDLAQSRAELVAKYGPPGFEGPVVGTGEVRLLAWSFKGDKPAPCPRSSCRAYVSEGLSVGNMMTYQRAVTTGHDMTVIATQLTAFADPTKVSSVLVTISDAATKLRTLESAIAQMKAATAPAPRGKAKP